MYEKKKQDYKPKDQQASQASVSKIAQKDPDRIPVIPVEWIKEYDKRQRLKRRQRIKRQLAEKKAEAEKKQQRAQSELGWAAWVQKKEIEKLNRLVD